MRSYWGAYVINAAREMEHFFKGQAEFRERDGTNIPQEDPKILLKLLTTPCPGQVAQLSGASFYTLEDSGFYFWSGHLPRFWFTPRAVHKRRQLIIVSPPPQPHFLSEKKKIYKTCNNSRFMLSSLKSGVLVATSFFL